MSSNFGRLFPTVALAAASTVALAQDNSARRAEALATISSFAREICTPVDANASSTTVKFTADAEAKFNLLLTKIADLGVGAGATFTDTKSKGVLQADLARAYKDGNECRLQVLDKLVDRLLPIQPQDTDTERTALKMAGLWNSTQDKDTFYRVDIRGRNFHSTEFGRYGKAVGSTIDAVVTGDIAEGMAYLEPNTKFGETVLKERHAIGTVLLRLSQDGQRLVGTFTSKNGAVALKVEWVRQ